MLKFKQLFWKDSFPHASTHPTVIPELKVVVKVETEPAEVTSSQLVHLSLAQLGPWI